MADKLAIVFDGPPANESGRFVEVELNGAGISFGEWQENGDYWELVLPDPYTGLAVLKDALRLVEDYGLLSTVNKLEDRLIIMDHLRAEVENVIGMARSFANFPSWLEQLEDALAVAQEEN